MFEFYDREEELNTIERLLSYPPNLITFVYGPINSGKSAVMLKLIERAKNCVFFYIDLRLHMISRYNDFLRVLFEVHSPHTLRKFLEDLPKSIGGIPIPKKLLEDIFVGKREDVFEYIVEVFERIRDRGKTPVLVLDELQKIGDLKIDSELIYELFNFFVSVTKQRHLAHVFCVTLDSLFLEKIYRSAVLHGRADFLLVDDFDHPTAAEGFLRTHGFDDDEIEIAWSYLGGKPVYLTEAIRNRSNLQQFCERLLKMRIRQILEVLEGKIPKLFKLFKDREVIEYDTLTDELRMCVRENIVFVDPVNRIVKPQSRIDLLVMRSITDKYGEE